MAPPRRGTLLLALLAAAACSPGALAATAAATTPWSKGDYPNPMKDTEACGRKGVQSRVCDPDGVISYESANVVEGVIQKIEAAQDPFKGDPCGELGVVGYQVGRWCETVPWVGGVVAVACWACTGGRLMCLAWGAIGPGWWPGPYPYAAAVRGGKVVVARGGAHCCCRVKIVALSPPLPPMRRSAPVCLRCALTTPWFHHVPASSCWPCCCHPWPQAITPPSPALRPCPTTTARAAIARLPWR